MDYPAVAVHVPAAPPGRKLPAMSQDRDDEFAVQSATDLPVPAKRDQDRRMRNYAIAMLIRTLAFVLAFVLDGPARWICVIFAALLPEVAVIGANAANQKRHRTRGRQVPTEPLHQLHGPRG